jgi:hypothetical protein
MKRPGAATTATGAFVRPKHRIKTWLGYCISNPISTGTTSMLDPRAVAYALGGEVVGRNILAPGPGHSRVDRSLSIKIDPAANDGFIVHSFAGDDPIVCRDYVRTRLGLPAWQATRKARALVDRAPAKSRADQAATALRLWRRRRSIAGTPAERYLRVARGYFALVPPTLGYLPAFGVYPHAMIAAFGLPTEPEPGILSLADGALRGVHITRLAPDGFDRDRGAHAKIMIAHSIGSPIVVAPVTDMLGMAIAEGIEDALAVHAATGLGAWAAGSASRLPALADAIPAYVETVTIMVDPDDAGRRHSSDLAARLTARGIEVRLSTINQEIAA